MINKEDESFNAHIENLIVRLHQVVEDIPTKKDILNDIINELKRINNYVQEIETWKQGFEDDIDIERKRRSSQLFSLGSWWADRPWRKI